MPNLTIHLLRKGLKHFSDAVGYGDARHYSIDIGERHIGDLYVAPKQEKSPPWAAFFKGYVDDLSVLGKVKSTGAVLIVHTESRHFALTFGQGQFILNQDMIEERFGLLATLNSLESDALRSIDKENVRCRRPKQSRAGRFNSSAQDFGVDIKRDLIKGIVGFPKETKMLGRRMSGDDALTVSRDINLTF
ncbi:uncharacterized protein (TIGR04141 family) [Luteibacter sp. OK325]|uniref:DUF6119 family protein n=1 Tax=Luteibacter sp. OK325 TaxID=2135670 RepID=UPI000D4F08D7|nr:DUF6119 family protein [Luteibacter sp. OK325]PTR35367.1 uncharacterized protein (TIGR04141 family) [Luteibacter sp. OK325]